MIHFAKNSIGKGFEILRKRPGKYLLAHLKQKVQIRSFQYNMPLRALAKMTNGAISMGMVDGIVMELQGFWILGLVRVIYEAIKNVVLNAQMEKRLRGA